MGPVVVVVPGVTKHVEPVSTVCVVVVCAGLSFMVFARFVPGVSRFLASCPKTPVVDRPRFSHSSGLKKLCTSTRLSVSELVLGKHRG